MAEDEASKERTRMVHDLAPDHWDTTPMTIAHELRSHILATMGDAGKGCDSGGGDGVADLHPWIGGREYHIQIRPTPVAQGLGPDKAQSLEKPE